MCTCSAALHVAAPQLVAVKNLSVKLTRNLLSTEEELGRDQKLKNILFCLTDHCPMDLFLLGTSYKEFIDRRQDLRVSRASRHLDNTFLYCVH